MQFELLKSFILKSIIRTNTEILSPYATSPIDQVGKKIEREKIQKTVVRNNWLMFEIFFFIPFK